MLLDHNGYKSENENNSCYLLKFYIIWIVLKSLYRSDTMLFIAFFSLSWSVNKNRILYLIKFSVEPWI